MSEPATDGQVSESTRGAGLRVAVAGKEGGRVDKHFGAVEIFLIYDLSAAADGWLRGESYRRTRAARRGAEDDHRSHS